MKNLFISNSVIETSINVIVNQICKSNFQPDVIACLGRGGMIPSRLMSDALGINEIAYIPARSYTGIGKKSNVTMGNLNVPVYRKKVLLIDDILDSGNTIDLAISLLRKAECSDIKTATIVCKVSTITKPSYFNIECDNDEWIIFPWEKKEFQNEFRKD